MDQEILEKFEQQEKKLEEIWKSIEKMRKYFLWTLIVTIATILVPLIALAFVIPWFLKIMTSAYSGL
jgi:type II secretory pathway component PulF